MSTATTTTVAAPAPVMVGGAEMLRTRNIVENASNSRIHATLVAAVKAADLVDTLSSPGPFTVFAPTDSAFAKLPEGTIGTLLQPANKMMLQNALKYHVVSGNVTAADLISRIRAGGGMATIPTVAGGTLTAKLMGGNVVLTDANGGTATVTQADVMQSNGIIHVVDNVLMPM
ncbi:MAG: fasciclin domain-containing protein [Pontixanthobacter sp.]